MSIFSAARLKRGLQTPSLFGRELNRWYHRRLYTRPYNTAGVDIFEADWDNMLVLDACRYDMFRDQHKLDGRLESRISRASSTREWLHANFADRDLLDTVYVTASPMLFSHRDSVDVRLHATVEIWQEEDWDETYNTVLPETVTERALEAARQYPNKRLLVHYLQPHYPFLTDDDQPFGDSLEFLKPDEPGNWNQIMAGDISVDTSAVWRAYRETLDKTFSQVERLLDALDEKSVVTADHGNMVGERARPVPIREWGHPHSLYTDQLVRVPWFVVDGDRRSIEEDPPVEDTVEANDNAVEQRLADLGYV